MFWFLKQLQRNNMATQTEEEKMYQFGEALRRLEDNAAYQNETLKTMNQTLEGIGKVLERFSGLSEDQTRLKTVVEGLVRDNEEIKEFMKNSSCKEHTVKLKSLKEGLKANQEADNSQNKNIVTVVITAFGALITGLITWFATKQ